MQPRARATGRFETPHASRYLQQLCKHFAHKLEVRYDDTSGEVALPTGPCRLTAGDGCLIAEVAAEDETGLERARAIIDSHLARFAFRESFRNMSWS
ncbi:hypothetical protein SAMN05216257_105298 [Meinhardsimonia xiamenensis]|jgi:hypothetical protein|uniref:2,4-dihydroxyhept-2-ene-1,7-dioic acid aldolase n=1 Tax=Meinhardsimonia xiamenensis TaxID=990712 RepID=A0A1G9FQ06_9RHOB|nr:DUF2218 domain-containing protein [Meinhardsimonia xiamenensis]PRX37738.1 hypothetical protein LV81_00006 [Meinhardsimonia xiamenensis]SDK90484.1 hypothetical protein SAMN05216257_105298 [Meinhardsimonia xiamenensis]